LCRILDSNFTEGTGNPDAWGPLERFVAEEYIVDTIWAFEPGYRRAAVIPATEQLASLPLPSDHPEQCQFMVAETLFAEMLALPKSSFTPVFYHIIIQDLCKIIPTFPPKMAKTMGAMFRAIDRMDVGARDRLSNWLAHQISCFDLVWPWSSWKHVMEQSEDAPQRMFCREVLRKLCQLSFVERVQKSLIEELHPLLPANVGLNAEYVNAAAQEAVFGELQSMLAAKQQGPEVLQWVASAGYAKATPEVLLRSLAVAVLERGQKCITHHDVLLKRYALPLRELVEKVGGEVLVDVAAGVWQGHPQMAPIAVERLLALELVRPEAVVNWLLQRATMFGEGNTYEIANVVCGFVCANKAEAIGKRQSIMNKLREAEAEASGAGAAAEDLAAQGRHFEAQHAQAAEARAVDDIAVHQAALATADAPVEHTSAVVREVCLNLCGGLVKGVSSGASVAVADRVLALVRDHRAELALDADAIINAAGTKKAAKAAVAAALGVPL
jgi:nuclear cap-binding protein subunit 1